MTAVMSITTSFVAVKAVTESLTTICKVRLASVAFRLFSSKDPMYVNEAKEALISATVPCRVKAPDPSVPITLVAPDGIRLSVPVGTLKATSSIAVVGASTSAMLMVFAPVNSNNVSSIAVTVLGLVKVGALFTERERVPEAVKSPPVPLFPASWNTKLKLSSPEKLVAGV